MEYKINKPYPEIKVEKADLEYALLLLNSYAGEVSEDTATHLYLFQSFSLESQYEKYATILEKIAIVEMSHLELLAKTINALGLKPAYMAKINDKFVPWNASYVNYAIELEEMLKIDIRAETKAIDNYYELIKEIKDKNIQKLLERIIEDEKLHLKIFKQLYEEVTKKD